MWQLLLVAELEGRYELHQKKKHTPPPPNKTDTKDGI